MTYPLFDYTFKLLLLGDASVGKTTLTHKYVSGIFLDNPRLTIGVDFLSKKVVIDGKSTRLQIWDFGGEDRFRFLLPTYCKGANGAIFVYDITNSKSLNHLPDWTRIVKLNAGDIPIFLVGSKQDSIAQRTVSYTTGVETAKEHNLAGFLELSSKTGFNVEESFVAITRIMISRTKK
ncbi:MAG: small GTP-binding protein [Promethearchaeota archaeon CR_4]|nr:MAG: small GTP-binding protein [Candidatus Lokiarchaeota archaeon CR_4]